MPGEESTNPIPLFLRGGGEMGELTRNFDWSKTPLGPVEQWGKSLRTVVAMILSSKSPMFLWWGNDLIQFYNDAYRPSLGNEGKHPLALGQRGKDCWTETWDIIHPLIKEVWTTGEAFFNEDQMIPIYRNGKLEEVYWTFGYSPIIGDSEIIEGILVICQETTQKVKAVQELLENEQKYKTIAENQQKLAAIIEFSPELIGLASMNATIQYLNPAGMEMLGWDSFEGRKVIDCIYPEDKKLALQLLPQLLEKQSFQQEIRFWNEKTKQYFWLQWNGIAIKDPISDKITGLATVSHDITTRKLTEQALKESEQQVRSLVESAPFPIGVYVGKEMKIILANQSILDVWGKGNDVIGKLYSEVLPELYNQSIFEQLDSVYTTGIAFHARNQRVDLTVNSKLRPYYFNYSFTPLYDASGHVYGVMNTAADVTDLNLAKQKVEENEKSFRNTILKAPVAMCIFRGPQCVVEIANDRMLELLGRSSSAEVLGKPVFDAVPEARNQGFEKILDEVYHTGNTFTGHDTPVKLMRKGKLEQIYIDLLFEAYKEPNNNISGVIVVALEVTRQVYARRKIEEIVTSRTLELASANNKLLKSNAELEQFAYVASHDLQEPIRKISTFTELLERSLADIDSHSGIYLNKIKNATVRMHILIRDLLAYSQLSKEKEVFSVVNLQETIENIKNDLDFLIVQKEAIIEYSDLPSIEAIPVEMTQLFSNLISNSLKFARSGIRPVITISASIMNKEDIIKNRALSEDAVYYLIELRDNGIGFEQQYAEQIFNIFQRLHGNAEYTGTGIGLAICKKIAQSHRGDIYASGSLGSGAIFNIILPVKQS